MFKTYWAQWHRLAMEGDLLYRLPKNQDSGPVGRRFVAPHSMRVEVFKALHHSRQGLHQGVNKTLALLKSRYYWPQMGRDVRQWCGRCHVCGETKPMTMRTRSRLQQTTVGAPFEKTAVDLMAPFAETPKRNKYILVMQDYFTNGSLLRRCQIRSPRRWHTSSTHSGSPSLAV